MFTKILLLALVSQGMGFKPRNNYNNNRRNDDHGHSEDECVDVSKYGHVQYNTTMENICSYKVERDCWPKSQRVCVSLPSTECTMEAGYTCNIEKSVETVRCDETEVKSFTPKKCVPDGFKTLREVKQVPECHEVTKQVCDSKWEINAQGEKVFASNENCRDKTWEQCDLVDKVIEEQVPAHTCRDEAVETYLTVLRKEEQTTNIKNTCSATGGAVCRVSSSTDCTEVEWTECEERIITDCNKVTVKIPYQEYDHLLRCKIQH